MTFLGQRFLEFFKKVNVSADFEPYSRWLGIPPHQSLRHHYVLLGLPPFESNPATIQQAAHQRMTYLHGPAMQENAAWAQHLLKELAAAHSCLLNPTQKVAYDQWLAQTLGLATPSQSQPVSGQPVSGQPVSPGAIPPGAIPAIPSHGSSAIAGYSGAGHSGAAQNTAGHSNAGHGGPAIRVAAEHSSPSRRATPSRGANGSRRRQNNTMIVVGSLGALVVVAAVAAVWGLAGDETAQGKASSASAVAHRRQVAEDPSPRNPSQAANGRSAAEKKPEGRSSQKPATNNHSADEAAQRTSSEQPAKNPLAPEGPPSTDDPETPEKAKPVAPITVGRWADARVTVRSVRIGEVKGAGIVGQKTMEVVEQMVDALVVNLTIENTSTSQPLQYVSVLDTKSFDSPLQLRDDHDKYYRSLATGETADPMANLPPAKVIALNERNFSGKVFKAKLPVVVQFYAKWSESCQQLKPTIDYLSQAYAKRVLVCRFDVGGQGDPPKYQLTPTLEKLKVKSVPAVMVFQNGKEVAHLKGVVPLGVLEEGLDQLVPKKQVVAGKTIPPSQSIQEVLAFELPSTKAKTLFLDLPAASVAGQGTLEFVLPMEMVQGRQP